MKRTFDRHLDERSLALLEDCRELLATLIRLDAAAEARTAPENKKRPPLLTDDIELERTLMIIAQEEIQEQVTRGEQPSDPLLYIAGLFTPRHATH